MSDVRHPQEDNVCCDLCEGKEFDLLHAWEVGNFWNPASIPIAVWQCRACELVILHPVPTAEQLPAEGEWWTSQRKWHRRRRWLKQIWEPIRHKLTGTPQTRIIRSTRKVIKEGRLLDVGCGMGKLMQAGSKYYDCVGLDPSPVSAKQIRDLGFPIVEATLEDADLEPGSFDIVAMESVLEHVHEPTNVLTKINSLLRVGGVVFVNVPKFDGPAYRRHGAGWNGFRHGYHTFLFTGETLGKFYEKTGFEVLQNPKRDRMLDDVLILWGRKVRDVAPAATRSAAA